MNIEKFDRQLRKRISNILKTKAPTSLRKAKLILYTSTTISSYEELVATGSGLASFTVNGYLIVRKKPYKFLPPIRKESYKIFHLRVDGGFKERCVQRLAISPHLRRLGIGSCIINTLAEFAYADGECVSAFVGGYEFMDSGLDNLLGEPKEEEVDNIAFWESLGFVKSNELLDMGRDDYYVKSDSVQV